MKRGEDLHGLAQSYGGLAMDIRGNGGRETGDIPIDLINYTIHMPSL
jgi:hypothetical protein